MIEVPEYILPNIRYKGFVSNFGGPRDKGVGEKEPVALYDHDEADARPDLFMPRFVTLGGVEVDLARRLDPCSHYCACRWDYGATPKELLRKSQVFIQRVDDLAQSVCVSPVDWGPNIRTGRIIDLSPAAFNLLRLIENTDETPGTLVYVTLQTPTARWSELQPKNGGQS